MIAHDMDPPDLYPYKGPQMRKLFKAFREILHARALAGLTARGVVASRRPAQTVGEMLAAG
jgi:hypothetical protein